MNITKRLCKCGCGTSIAQKHVNARFANQKHKDKYWNTVNPRGMFAHLKFQLDSDSRHIFDVES